MTYQGNSVELFTYYLVAAIVYVGIVLYLGNIIREVVRDLRRKGKKDDSQI